MVDKTYKINTQPLRPIFDVSFWTSFTKLKLDIWRLQAPSQEIYGTVSLPNNVNNVQDLSITQNSFQEHYPRKHVMGGLISCLIPGLLIHTNTIEEFSLLDLNALESQEQQKLCQEMPNRFLLCIFGDLKNYVYHYKFIHLQMNTDHILQVKATKVSLAIPQYQEMLCEKIQAKFKKRDAQIEQQFFIVDDFACFIDCSPKLPSALLTNYLFIERAGKVILIRDKLSKLSPKVKLDCSIYMEFKYGVEPTNIFKPANIITNTFELKTVMDPASLAHQAVSLNLKLMKWRQAPDLNLSILEQTSCLLLGAGSLGCQVARNLLSWGFTSKITFVDSGRVSYSNPVRQCLFTFEDSQQPDNYKAQIAAKRLKEIYPKVDAQGVTMSIPMPGHSVGSDPDLAQKMLNETSQLEDLIKSHDVVFLLLDSREARWLPTVLSVAHKKICITVALGFDTFLVMRHGLSPSEAIGPRLGCYFCNDVVQPTNSTQDRTLDQQCTTSRPALCCMASSLSVELLTSILNHPLKNAAQAHEDYLKSDRSCLGILPQQIRGDLSTFETRCLYGLSYDRCTGCSQTIQEAFSTDPLFMVKVCNDPRYLEDLSGLTQMKENINFDDVESFNSDDLICD